MDADVSISGNKQVSRSWFLRAVLAQTALVNDAFLGTEVAHRYVRQIGISLALAIQDRYSDQWRQCAMPANVEAVVEFLTDLNTQLHTGHEVVQTDQATILLMAPRCPWADFVNEVPSLCQVLACMYGALAAHFLGYATVSREHADECAPCRLYLHFNASVQTPEGEVFTRADLSALPASDDPVSLLEMVRQYQQELLTAQMNYEQLYRKQLELSERLEQALAVERAAAEELRMLNRLKQDFLANVSHELRTPITAMHGYLSLLQQDVLGSLNDEQHSAVQITIRNLDRLNRLVGDLLDYSSIARGQYHLHGEPVAVTDILAAGLERVQESAIEKGISLEGRVHGGLGRVLGDREKLTQVVEHLLGNAVKFSGPCKKVTLSAQRREMQTVIEVTDTGIGMTPEQLERAFLPFVQGDTGLSRRFGGLGVGLALIHNLVALHGGDIAITSTPGVGTTVLITLPVTD